MADGASAVGGGGGAGGSGAGGGGLWSGIANVAGGALGLLGSSQPSQAQNLTSGALSNAQGMQGLERQGLSALGGQYGLNLGWTPGANGSQQPNLSVDANWNPMSGPGYANLLATEGAQNAAADRQAAGTLAAQQHGGVNQLGNSLYNLQQGQNAQMGQAARGYFGQQLNARQQALGSMLNAGSQGGSQVDSLIQSLAKLNQGQQQSQSSSLGSLIGGIGAIASLF